MRLSLRHYGIKITHPLSVLQADGHSIHERSERHSNKEAFAPVLVPIFSFYDPITSYTTIMIMLLSLYFYRL